MIMGKVHPPVALLARSVPDLRLDSFPLSLNALRRELHADR